MRIHHLDCGTLHPPGGALIDGASRGAIGRLVCHCLLLETARHGLVLVDTGFGMDDVRHPFPRLPALNVALLRPSLDPARTAIAQVRSLGFRPEDVRHLVLTHLDFDHAGGLTDFPWATVHLTEAEARAATRREGPIGRLRWRPAQWGHTGRWRPAAVTGGEPWFGLAAAPPLEGLPDEIRFVPLPGHTPGQAGVAVHGPRGWLLHAADAYFNRAEVAPGQAPTCPPATYAYERLMETDARQRVASRDRVRRLLREHGDAVVTCCTHDPVEFVALAAWSAGGPALPAAA